MSGDTQQLLGKFASLNSLDKPAPNADGSYDIYLRRPEATRGKESDWKTEVSKDRRVI